MSELPLRRPMRLLTVCTHNRTRSVMMAALLGALLREQLGADAVRVKSSGFGPAGLAPIPDAVEAMRRRGLDVSHHRSAPTTATLVNGADLILTAERDHVVKIAALSRAAFTRTFTLPEFLSRAVSDPMPASTTVAPGCDRIADWAEQISAQRRAAEYLRDPVAEVADPTGSPARAFEAAVVAIEQQCREVVAHLDRVALAP